MRKELISSKARRFRRWFTFLAVAVVSLLLMTQGGVFATEMGGGAYPNGAEDFMAGALPPPGTYFINYLFYYSANDFKDSSKHTLIPGFDLKVTANVFRFIYITNAKVFGASWGMHVFVPVVNVHVETDTPLGNDSKLGLGDIIIDPLILGWHFKNLHLTTGIDIYVPTGNYDKNDLANTGRNYWTFEPIIAFTYLSDGGFEVTSKFMYDFNTKNTEYILGDYKSGQEFHFDYTVGQKLGNWRLGVGGYYYLQTTNDELNGQKVGSDGFKGKVFAVGPQVKYDYKNISFTLKYQKEMEVKNRPEGEKFWFKFSYAF